MKPLDEAKSSALTYLSVQWRHYKTSLAHEFHILVDALDEMARRWIGPVLKDKATTCLASLYASQLRTMHTICQADPDYKIDVLGYSNDLVHYSTPFSTSLHKRGAASSQNPPTHPQQTTSHMSEGPSHLGIFSPGTQLNSPGSSESNHIIRSSPQQTLNTRNDSQSQLDGLTAISHTLMNNDFLSMDRIISLDDMIFAAPTGTPPPWMTADID